MIRRINSIVILMALLLPFMIEAQWVQISTIGNNGLRNPVSNQSYCESDGKNKDLDILYTGYLAQSGNFTVELSLDKPVYIENEKIILNIKVKNIGNSVDSIQNFHEYGFASHIKIIDKLGKKIPYSFLMITGIQSYTLINPEEEVNFTVNILTTHGAEPQDSFDPVNKKYFANGKYNVEFSPDLEYFGKNLNGNTISFDIITPSQTEIGALNSLRKIYKIKNFEERSLKYKDFAMNNLESVYMEQAFYDYQLIGVSKHIEKYSDMVVNDCEWFINLRPNSAYMSSILRGCIILLEKYKNKSEAESFLNKIINKYPATKASMEALVLLKKY